MEQHVIRISAVLFVVAGLFAFPAASTAQVVKEYRVDADGKMYEVNADRPVPEVAAVPQERRVTYTRLIVPSDRYVARAEPRSEGIYGYEAPESQAPVRQVPGHDSLWYGDSYTDDWMYSLKDYNLRDDYRLLNRQSAQADTGGQVYGYVESEEAEEPARQVSGEVSELSMVDTTPVPRLAIVVQTDEGLLRRVLLGAVQDARKLSLSLGDRVTVAGRPDLVNGVSMLVASRLERTRARQPVTISESRAQAAPRPAPPRAAPENWYHGTIVRTRTERPPGQNRDVLMATVLLDDGNIVVADLGPADQLPVNKFQPNDRVTLLGRTRQNASGEPVLVVDSLRLESETMQINR